MPHEQVLGRPLWYELQTPDLAAAEAFYTDVVGWTVTAFPGLPYRYATWMRPGGIPVGGGMEFTPEMRAEGVRANWMPFFATPSIETSVGLAERLGGIVALPLLDVPDVGRIRAVRDPQRAVFCLFQPLSPPQKPLAPAEPGEAAWLELLTSDALGGLAFYQALLGWQPTEALDMGEMGTYQMFGQEAHSIGGVLQRPPTSEVPPHWSVYFRVEDIEAAAARATGHGARIVSGPMEVPGGGCSLQGIDPQGAEFSLFQQA